MKKSEALEFLKKADVIQLATIDNDQPCVRPMALIHHNDCFWCATVTSRTKTKQLEQNPKFEFLYMIPSEQMPGSLRASGRAEIISDSDVKRELSQVIPFFDAFWKVPEDPEYTLIKLHVQKLNIQHPQDRKFYEFEI